MVIITIITIIIIIIIAIVYDNTVIVSRINY